MLHLLRGVATHPWKEAAHFSARPVMKSEELVCNERTLVSSISTCRRSLRFHSVFTEPRRYFHDASSDAFKQCCYLIHWIVHTHTLTHTLSNACKTQMESVVTLPFPVISNMNSVVYCSSAWNNPRTSRLRVCAGEMKSEFPNLHICSFHFMLTFILFLEASYSHPVCVHDIVLNVQIIRCLCYLLLPQWLESYYI